MHTPRTFLRMVAAAGHLYAIGGNSGHRTNFSVERYDPTSNSWTSIAPLQQNRAVPGAVVRIRGSERLIFVVGGAFYSGSQSVLVSSTEVYDLNTGRWRTLAVQLPRARASLVCALEADGTVLAIGGEDERGVTAAVEALRVA